MFDVIALSSFKKAYKLMLKRGYDMQRLEKVVDDLAQGNALPPHFRDHALTGNYRSWRECHIAPDWLLIYRIDRGALQLLLLTTGTHSDVF